MSRMPDYQTNKLQELEKLFLILNPSAIEIPDVMTFRIELESLVEEDKDKNEMIKILEAENKRLMAAVKEAFKEGYESACELNPRGNFIIQNYLKGDYNMSQARKVAEPRLTDLQTNNHQ